MVQDVDFLRRTTIDLFTCCMQRDSGQLPGDKDPCSLGSTLRSKRGSGTVERQALIAEHITKNKSFASVYDLNTQDVLGTGSFGTVRTARLKRCPSIIRAVKEVHKCDPNQTKLIRREVDVLRNLDHPNICKLFETFEDQQRIYLVMELIKGRPLIEEVQDNVRRGHLNEKWNVTVMSQIFDGLRYCHNQGVLHNDLKLENVMVDKVNGEVHIKLIDFGTAVMLEPCTGYHSKIFQGTQAYMAPEVIASSQYSTASDMWSAGVILFLLYVGEFPDSMNMHGQIQTIDNPDARELLLCILQVDPWLRMSADEASEHPWTCGIGAHGQTGDLQKAMTSFLDFYRCDKLQKALLTAVASQLCGQQLQHMRKDFQQLDSNGNGVVTEQELIAIFEANPPPSIKDPSKLVHEIFDQLDSDGSGELEFTEFQAAVVRSYVGISEDAMQAAFHALDVDSSGTISQEELGRVMQASNEELMSYMAHADLNGDGVLDFDEFKAVFAALPVSLADTGGPCNFDPVCPGGLAANSVNPTMMPSVKAPTTEEISNHLKHCEEQQLTPPLYCFTPRGRSLPCF